MKRTENKENAVSPVVGVMLMLVVTIIIAAVVAMFATGVATDVSTAPNAVLDVHIYSDKAMIMEAGNASNLPTHVPDLVIKHLGGDDLNTGNLSLTFSWDYYNSTDKKTYTYRTVYDGSAIDESSKVSFNGGYGDRTGTSALYMNDGQNYAFNMSSGAVNPAVFFGKVTLKSGYQLQSLSNNQAMGVDHAGSPAMDAVLGAGLITEGNNQDFTKTNLSSTSTDHIYDTKGVMALLPKGTSVHVVITDLKSNTAIFDKEVAVE